MQNHRLRYQTFVAAMPGLPVTPERVDRLGQAPGLVDECCSGLGLLPPVRVLTGRGYHLVFAYPPIAVTDVSDVRDRLRSFKRAIDCTLRSTLRGN